MCLDGVKGMFCEVEQFMIVFGTSSTEVFCKGSQFRFGVWFVFQGLYRGRLVSALNECFYGCICIFNCFCAVGLMAGAAPPASAVTMIKIGSI